MKKNAKKMKKKKQQKKQNNINNKKVKEDKEEDEREKRRGVLSVVRWLLNIPATCLCISGMDLLRQF